MENEIQRQLITKNWERNLIIRDDIRQIQLVKQYISNYIS